MTGALQPDQSNPSRDDVANPASPCPGPCDVAIPIVYPNQPITIPAAEVGKQIPFDLDIRASLQATFTQPNSSPPLSIKQWNGDDAYVLGLGHAGIAMIDGATGAVRYYEYGRYDPAAFGQVRQVAGVSGITISFDPADGNPTRASLLQLGDALTRTNGGPYGFEAIYVKLANGAFATMVEFAEARKSAVQSRTANAYSVADNHCFTFAMEVAGAAGVRMANARSAPKLDVQLQGGNFLTRGVVGGMAPEFEVPARQMRALQQGYRRFNVSESGTIAADFQYPHGLNTK